MKVAPFTVQKVERTVEFFDNDEHSDEHDPGEIEPADFRAALDALESDYWDNLDVYGGGTTIIGYPADWHQDYRTGEYTSTQVIIQARRSEWLDRLLSVYEARKARVS